MHHNTFSPYRIFSADEWGALREGVPLTLNADELKALRGAGETIDLSEVEQIYLPLSRLLSLYVEAMQGLYGATNAFLGEVQKVPFIIGVAGSVAVGKSTTSRILRALLARWPSHPHVALVTTDGFFFPNAILEERKLMNRKGFPESFDIERLRQFLADVKSGKKNVRVPVYSHVAYDIVEGEELIVSTKDATPDILIVEGLNVLQPMRLKSGGDDMPFVSDYFDFSIYIDAAADIIRDWYIARFLSLKRTAFREPGAYFQRYAELNDTEARKVAKNIWDGINRVNLEENIFPTRSRGDLILHKRRDHHINEVHLRKI